MKKIIRYAAHYKPLALPPQLTNMPIENDADYHLSSVHFPLSLIEHHQQFIQQQTDVHHYFLQQQQQMWQNLINLPLPSEIEFKGPQFSRTDLEMLASGTISTLFGEWFKPLDQYQRLIRMPEPPLLLADRVLGIDAKPGSLEPGTLWTETDITADAWYLHQDHIPAGIMIEAGQADLLLASWLGFDFQNKGERVYRLLGGDYCYLGNLPKVGDTLRYDIHIDGHAKLGSTYLFFFHYNCTINGELRATFRNGQAGFFSDEELSESKGILWDSKHADYNAEARLDPPVIKNAKQRFSHQELQQFAQGDIAACFDSGFEITKTHTRTPRISSGKMLLLDEITDFDTAGGPWQRGYMRAIQKIDPEKWFFQGHFKNDPCMPGTLMFETGLQLMASYLTASGHTLDKDGWRFEPVIDEIISLRCGAQVIPTSKEVVYEIFVYSVVAAPNPTVYADLLATVDGLKAFHTRLGLRLVPGWPLTTRILGTLQDKKEHIIPERNGFKLDHASLLACALGKPSDAFGAMYLPFDNERRVARLPAPPYHFMTRITRLEGEMGQFKAGAEVECEFDIDPNAWYFKNNAYPVMPFCVFLESALQPCGWLASFIGSALRSTEDLLFRNLDGSAELFEEIKPDAGTLRTHVKCTGISESAGMIIESFKVESFLADKCIYRMDTVFGYFPKTAFENQIGIPAISTYEKNCLQEPDNLNVDLRTQPQQYFNQQPALPAAMLLMIDRVTGFWPTQGKQQLGLLRAEKFVNPDEWFFKAHFFQDPVQPGSLGIEAAIQLLQFFMLHQNLGKDIPQARFCPLLLNTQFKWKYRGQVIPRNKVVNIVLEITACEKNEKGSFASGDASLWVDGKRIYEMINLGMQIQSDGENAKKHVDTFILDPEKETWIKDHCPTYTLPTLPMMSMVEYIACAAHNYFPDKKIVCMENLHVHRWVLIEKPVTLVSEVEIINSDEANVILYLKELEEKTIIMKAKVTMADHFPQPLSEAPRELTNTVQFADPYSRLPHGPAFHIVESLRINEVGSSSLLKAKTPTSYQSYLNPVLLDGVTHGIPFDNLTEWNSEISSEQVGYPILIPKMEFFSDTPQAGMVRCEIRSAGFHQLKHLPKFDVTFFVGEKIWTSFTLVSALFHKGPLGLVTHADRRAFLQHKQYVPNVSLSSFKENQTHLAIKTVKEMDWLPGSLTHLYEVSGEEEEITQQIAIKEHLAKQLQVHPSVISIDENGVITNKLIPGKKHKIKIKKMGNEYIISS